jgi:NAD(P)-dependent dehydrogenase (short-subunit alcohol dehydrogenase family)
MDVDFRPSPRILSTEALLFDHGANRALKELSTMPRALRRVAVVTGGGRGIGRGIVKELAARRFSVVVNYRTDLESARSACAEATSLGAPRAIALQADVADIDSGIRLLEEALTAFGKIDLWVNNAGIAPETRLDVLETTPESWDRVLATNLRGPFFLTQAVAQSMLERKNRIAAEPQIVFITSISSTFASTNRPEYCVAKAGLSMVVQLFAARLAEQGIRVYEIRPGLIETDMTRPVHAAHSERIKAGISPIRRWGTPADVGRAVAAIAAGTLPFSTGEVIHIDGGLHLRIL